MTSPEEHVALDSQCYSYLIGAMNGLQEPTGPLADQYIALFRIFLYRRGGLFVLPRVRQEFLRISDPVRAALHSEWTVLFPETRPIDELRIEARVRELLEFHGDADDCRILAEAEDASISVIITFDDRFIRRLQAKTRVRLVRPTEYWAELQIPRGSAPATSPRFDNPMSAQSWWRW